MRKLRPRKTSRRGEALTYDDVLYRNVVHTTTGRISCEADKKVTFDVRLPPGGGELPIQTKTDALDLLLGSEWLNRDSSLREPKSALVRALANDGVEFGLESVYHIRELMPLVAERYIASFHVVPPQMLYVPALDRIDELSHAQVREVLLGPWPTATVEVEVTDPRWLEHLRDGGHIFALRDSSLPAPSTPPEREDPLAGLPPAPDERVVLWRDTDKHTRWIGERRGAEVIKRWGRRDSARAGEPQELRIGTGRVEVHRHTGQEEDQGGLSRAHERCTG